MMFKLLRVNIFNFGKLHDFKMDFEKGLNVIAQDNGFGKTTLAAFIKAMFYGLNYNKKRKVSENEVLKYRPFNSTEKFGGTLSFFCNGKNLRIERFFGNTEKEQEIRLFDEDTNKQQKLDFEKGELGLRIFKVDADAFMRSMYLPQCSIIVENNDSFMQKLSNLAENTDETNNYVKADTSLREYCKKLKLERGNGGKIFDLKCKVEEKEKQLINANNIQTKIKDINDEIVLCIQEITKSDNEVQQLTAQKSKAEKEAASLSKYEEIAEKQNLLNLKQTEIKLKEQQLDNLKYLRPEPPEKIDNVLKSKTLKQILLCALLILCGVGLCFWLWYLSLPFFVGGIALSVIFYIKCKKAEFKIKNTNQRLLEEYNNKCAQTEKEFSELKLDITAQLKALKLNAEELTNTLLILAPEGAQKLKDRYIKAQSDLKIAEQQLIQAKIKYDNNRDKLNISNGALLTLNADPPSPPDIENELLNLKEEINQTEQKYNTAQLARQILSEAKESLTDSYLPMLNTSFKKYVELLAQKRLGEAAVDAQFNITINEAGAYRDSDYLSEGFKEMCNFALRLSLMECIYKDDLPLIILDDPFVNYDDINYSSAKKLLEQISLTTQVIYLTCHKQR